MHVTSSRLAALDVGTAASLASSVLGKGSKGGSGAGAGGAGPIAVSPTIQTQVSPQISPVFQQTGSGSQTAATSMIAPGGQSGKGGDAVPSSPYSSSQRYPTAQPYNDPFMPGFDVTRYSIPGTTPRDMIVAQQGPDFARLALWGGAIFLAGVLVYVLANPKKQVKK